MKQAEENADEGVSGSKSRVQRKQFCETMRPVEPWEQGLLGPEEARMIQLEIIYGVIIDLGRLDLNGDEMAGVEGTGEGQGDVQGAVGEGETGVDAQGEGESGPDSTLYDLELNNAHEDLPTLFDQPNPEAPRSDASPYFSEQSISLASSYSKSPSASLSDSALTPTLPNSKSYSPFLSTSASDPTLSPKSGFTTPRYIPTASFPRSAPADSSASLDTPPARPTSTSTVDSTSSLNLPELSPADSSRSSVASPAEPASPPEGSGADYVSTQNLGVANGSAQPSGGDYRSNTSSQDTDLGNSLPVPGLKSSADSSPRTDELTWHTPTGGGSVEDVRNGFGGEASHAFSGDGHHSFPGRMGAGASLGPPAVDYGYTRPGFGRRESTMSLGTSSEINPDDYADAEEWVDDGEYGTNIYGEDGDNADMDEGEETGEDGAATEMGAGEDEDGVATEMGETPMDLEGEGAEDAYIDDGAAAEEAAIGRVASMSLVAAVTSSGMFLRHPFGRHCAKCVCLGVVDDEIFTLFVEEVMRVSADPVYWVRSETSYALGTLAKAVGDETVEPYLVRSLFACRSG